MSFESSRDDWLRDVVLEKMLMNCSLQFNVVSKNLGSERMSHYLNEAAGDIRDLLLPGLEAGKAKL